MLLVWLKMRMFSIGFHQQEQPAGIPQSNINGDGKGRSDTEKGNAQFEANIERLKALKARHGHTNVPWNCKDDPTLGRWCTNMRASKPKIILTGSRISKLCCCEK